MPVLPEAFVGEHKSDRLLGQVVASHGRRWVVEVGPGSVLSCVSRARRSDIACGDRVRVAIRHAGAGVIEDVCTRTSVFFRREGERVKVVAANVTLVAIVFAVSPMVSTELLDRCLAAAEHAGSKILLVLNKTDLADVDCHAARVRGEYQRLGYRVLELAIDRGIGPLRHALHDELSVLVGQSGVGKSTLVNRLIGAADARIGVLSAGNAKGRHTTTHTQLYRLDAQSSVIDSPGMQVFGLSHIVLAELADAFVEFRTLNASCRFANCLHRGEPGCAIEQAVAAGTIAARRLESYRRILASLARKARAPAQR